MLVVICSSMPFTTMARSSRVSRSSPRGLRQSNAAGCEPLRTRDVASHRVMRHSSLQAVYHRHAADVVHTSEGR